MEITFGYQKNLVICSNSELLKRTWSNSTHDEKILIPDLEVLPYDNFSPHSEVSSKRLIALRDLLKKDSVTAFSTVPALFQPFFDKASINTLYLEFKENQKIDRNELISNLVENGYDPADLVTKPSSYALRGSVIDIFPSNSKYPVRIDLDDDLISSISIFDTDTQKTLRKINSFIVRPSRGFVLNINSIKIFKKNWRSRFKDDGEVFESVSKGKFISGIEFYSSLFYDEKPSLKDYLNGFNIFIVGDVKSESKNYWELINNRYEEFLGDVNRPILKPAEIFNSLDEINNLISESETINLPESSFDKSLDLVFKDSPSSSEQLERDFDSLLNFKKDDLIFLSKYIFNFYVDDPSNRDEKYQRIKVRKLIKGLNGEGLDKSKLYKSIINLKDSNETIKFYVKQNLINNTHYFLKKNKLVLNQEFFSQPHEVVFRALSDSIKLVGKKYYLSRGKKIDKIITQIQNDAFFKGTLGGCIIEKVNQTLIITKET